MSEYETLARIVACFPRSPAQVNGPFDSDAEFVRVGTELWGMTMDEFSADEDRFGADDPERLGANLAAATLADLLAAGVEPQFFMQALCLPRDADRRFTEKLCTGIAHQLARANCALCGGDLGTGDPWRYTGFAMGPLRAPRPLTRRIGRRPHALWVTGALGDLNVAALRGDATPVIELRLAEAQTARAVATAGIDTSGGLADALWGLQRASPGLRIEADLAALPYAPGVARACAAAGIPVESALFGGAGEYELLYAVPQEVEARHAAALGAAGLTRIGVAVPDAAAGVAFRRTDGTVARLSGPPPCPRSVGTVREHAAQAVAAASALMRNDEGAA
jgi:thiamine-monophosphate kinase